MKSIATHLPNGVAIHQATDEEADKCNIYCEFPWCPPDSHCFVYVRHAPEHDPNPMEYVSCDFGTWEKRVVGRGRGGHTMANGGKFYFKRFNSRGAQEFVECDLEKETERVLELPEGVPAGGSFDISKGGRYVAFSKALSFDSHPHAYISPDRKWVVFNSDKTGVQHIYAARIPDEMIRTLETPV